MQIPRLDPLPPTLAAEAVRPKTEDRTSVTHPATAAQLEPVGARARDRGRDPTLDPTRQRRERHDAADEQRRRPPHDERDDGAGDDEPVLDAGERPPPVRDDALQRAVEGFASAPPPALDLHARAFDLLAEWGRPRLQTGDLEASSGRGGRPPSVPQGRIGSAVVPASRLEGRAPLVPQHGATPHVHDPAGCAFCKAAVRAYRRSE